jgi:4-diphosphocytidyl-2-C-methyl-D-erythritol kinase
VRKMETITVKAPAKINLTLDVLHKRPDGYHEVEMVMTTIDLADHLHLTSVPRQNDILLECTASFVPNDQRNLVYQAVQLLKNKFDIKHGVNIRIDKQIPVAAGLAGGSSDAAATIKGLNQLWQLNLSVQEMAELGAELGSDISFCVYGGTALASGRGEIIEPLPTPPPFWVVLAKPPIGVSTGNVYSKLDVNKIDRHPDTAQMIRAIRQKDFPLMVASLGNVLEQVTLHEHAAVYQIKERMKRFGADGVLMSGSGPTVYGITQKESRVQRMYNALKGFCRDVYVVRSIG